MAANQSARIVMKRVQPPKNLSHWGQMTPYLFLVVYDTEAVAQINKRQKRQFEETGHLSEYPQFELKLPAKYAVGLHRGMTDTDIFAQVLLSKGEGVPRAVWFDNFNDLPYAVAALRKRFPDAEIPDQVSTVIDWPLDQEKREAGTSIIDATQT